MLYCVSLRSKGEEVVRGGSSSALVACGSGSGVCQKKNERESEEFGTLLRGSFTLDTYRYLLLKIFL